MEVCLRNGSMSVEWKYVTRMDVSAGRQYVCGMEVCLWIGGMSAALKCVCGMEVCLCNGSMSV